MHCRETGQFGRFCACGVQLEKKNPELSVRIRPESFLRKRILFQSEVIMVEIIKSVAEEYYVELVQALTMEKVPVPDVPFFINAFRYFIVAFKG